MRALRRSSSISFRRAEAEAAPGGSARAEAAPGGSAGAEAAAARAEAAPAAPAAAPQAHHPDRRRGPPPPEGPQPVHRALHGGRRPDRRRRHQGARHRTPDRHGEVPPRLHRQGPALGDRQAGVRAPDAAPPLPAPLDPGDAHACRCPAGQAAQGGEGVGGPAQRRRHVRRPAGRRLAQALPRLGAPERLEGNAEQRLPRPGLLGEALHVDVRRAELPGQVRRAGVEPRRQLEPRRVRST